MKGKKGKGQEDEERVGEVGRRGEEKGGGGRVKERRKRKGEDRGEGDHISIDPVHITYRYGVVRDIYLGSTDPTNTGSMR